MPPDNEVSPWILLQSVRLNFTSVAENTLTFSIKDPSNPDLYWGAFRADNLWLVKFMAKPDENIKKTATEITANASPKKKNCKNSTNFAKKKSKTHLLIRRQLIQIQKIKRKMR